MNLTLLKAIRRKHNLKLEMVSIETGISIGYLSRIEKGYVKNILNYTKRLSLEAFISKYSKKDGFRRRLNESL